MNGFGVPELGNCSPGRGREASGARSERCPAAGGQERAAGARRGLRKDGAVKLTAPIPRPAWKAGRAHGSEAGSGAGNSVRNEGSALPTPPKACLCSSGLGDPCSVHPSLRSGSAAAAARCPCRGVSVF